MTRRSNRWSKEKQRHFWQQEQPIEPEIEPETDEQQIEALLVDCGRTKLMFED